MKIKRMPRREYQLRLIPLIDIIFFLIFFFLVAGTVQNFEIIPVNLPDAVSGRSMEAGEVTLILGQHDELIVDDEMIEEEQLEARLKKMLTPESVITIKADQSLPARKLIRLMNHVKKAGGQHVSLVTQSR